jgi:mono/diheme cytochrome c family protein
MVRTKSVPPHISLTALCALGLVLQGLAQQPPAQPPGAPGVGGRGGRGGGGGGGGLGAYPQHPPADAALVERGRALYGVNCAFCHGSDARGGEGGPNLLRAQIVLNDQNGESIAPVVQNGRPDAGMPKIDLSMAQIADIAGFVHSFRVGGYDLSRNPPPSVLVGDAKAGEAYFKSKCGSCHSAAGDLKGIGARFDDPKLLQNFFVMPGGGRGGFGGGGGGAAPSNIPPTTVTVTLAGNQKVEGRLGRIDDFIVTLTQADGTPRTFRRDGDTPKVEIHDPMAPHKELMKVYTDSDIHNLTAYLVTVK